MKKYISIIVLLLSFGSVIAQNARRNIITSINYNELGMLISDDGNNGSARFNAMSGAFGALGSDLSSVAINPAGAVVGLKSKMSFSLDNSNTTANPIFMGDKDIAFKTNNFNFSNISGVMLFGTYKKTGWDRFALSFNYQLKNDFNSGFALKRKGAVNQYFNQNPDEYIGNNQNVYYQTPISQLYDRTTTGKSTLLNLSFSAVRNNELYLGASLNFHSFEFGEVAKLEEGNANDNGRKLNGFNVQESNYNGDGISLSFGAIYRLENMRLGFAVETPTWYGEIIDESNIFKQNYSNDSSKKYEYDGYTEIQSFTPPNDEQLITFNTTNNFEPIVFSFKTPTRLTASLAYVFSGAGLISVDYTFRNFNGIKYGGDTGFEDVNRDFSEYFINTNEINVGTEWRIKKWSLRGGYHYKENPNAKIVKSNVQGFSLGLGYNFGFANFDLSYNQNKHTDYYHIYATNDTWIDYNTSRITGTLTFNL